MPPENGLVVTLHPLTQQEVWIRNEAHVAHAAGERIGREILLQLRQADRKVDRRLIRHLRD